MIYSTISESKQTFKNKDIDSNLNKFIKVYDGTLG